MVLRARTHTQTRAHTQSHDAHLDAEVEWVLHNAHTIRDSLVKDVRIINLKQLEGRDKNRVYNFSDAPQNQLCRYFIKKMVTLYYFQEEEKSKFINRKVLFYDKNAFLSVFEFAFFLSMIEMS